MRMEFSRMNGMFLSQRPWPADGRSTVALLEEARNALASFYEGDEYSFWPKRLYAPNAPERVQIIDPDGAVIVEYGLDDFLCDSGRCLASRGPKQ